MFCFRGSNSVVLLFCESLRDNAVSVERSGIPHEWIATLGTGYIDTRFVKCVAVMLAKLEKKAAEAGIRL